MQKKLCIHCFISGRVQGVWFRSQTKELADQLDLCGWARNLPDGRVEVLACGESEKLASLHEWLKNGPPLAEVKDVSYEELDWQAYPGFKTM